MPDTLEVRKPPPATSSATPATGEPFAAVAEP